MGAPGTSHTSKPNKPPISPSARRAFTLVRLLSWRDAHSSEQTVEPPMSMIANLRPASDLEINRLLEQPSEITRFLYGAGAETRDKVVLDKAWHAIHFTLTGSRLGGDE